MSSVEGATHEPAGSTHSTPNTSPSGSLLRGQLAPIDAQGAQFVQSHLETLYRQNEQQRVVLSDLFAGLGLKMSQLPAGKSSMFADSTPHPGSIGSSTDGSLHRQESVLGGQTSLERQLQITIRENESLRRENEALKRELDRLRRGGL